LLGAHTLVRIPADGEKILRYGALFAPTQLDRVEDAQAGGQSLSLIGQGARETLAIDTRFQALKDLEKALSQNQ
jgi:hypothetical protein